MMRVVAGFDGGGTKTSVIVADEAGKAVHAFEVGALNYNGQDAASVRESLRRACGEIARVCGGSLDACAAICIGAAGISNPLVAARLTEALREAGYNGELVFAGDHEAALCGAHEGLSGMILIAGTGSIGYGVAPDGTSHRAGGFGHLIDDEGSGYSIGRELLSAVVRSADGREGPTMATRLVYGRLGIGTVEELVGFVYDKNRNKQEIAALAPLLSEACEAGDSIALAIARRSGEALAEIAAAVAAKLGMEDGELALLGSVLRRNRYVREAFSAALAARFPRVRMIEPKRDAAYGAVLLALEKLRASGSHTAAERQH